MTKKKTGRSKVTRSTVSSKRDDAKSDHSRQLLEFAPSSHVEHEPGLELALGAKRILTGHHVPSSTTLLIVFFSTALAMIAFAVIAYKYILDVGSSQVIQFPCTSTECKAANDYLHGKLAKHIDPCTDFYTFVCHSWMEHSGSFVEDTRRNFAEAVHNALLRQRRPEGNQFGIHLLFDFYRSCYAYMDARLGGIPNNTLAYLKDWNPVKTHKGVLLRLYQLSLDKGISTIFTVNFAKVGQEELLRVTTGQPLLLKTVYRPVGQTFKEYIDHIIRSLIHERDRPEIHHDVRDIDVTVHALYKKTPRIQPYVFRQLCDLIPNTDEHDWLEHTNKNLGSLRQKQSTTSDILIGGKELIVEVVQALENYSIDSVHMYCSLQLAMEILRYDYFRRFEIVNPFDRVWMCLSTTMAYISYTWPFLVASLATNVTNYNLVNITFNAARLAMKAGLDQIQWMELPSKLDARQKLEKVLLLIIEPSHLYHLSSLVDYYNPKSLPSDFIESFDIMSSLSAKLHQVVFGQESNVDIGRYQLRGVVQYLESENTIVVPTAMLMPPMFYPHNVDSSFNYGTLGVLISKLFASTIGPSGSLRMPDGTEDDWWTEDTRTDFTKHIECLVVQYTLLETSTTPSDNVVDQLFLWTFALKHGYNRFRRLLRGDLKSQLRLARQQTFFIRFCMMSCDSHNEKSDERLPKKYRCILPLMNVPAFTAAFNCKPGSPMAPRKRCPL
ncbi:neprilysin-like [Ornithodoros turicata]|uniref:neprilysin-like n=1 Tax=Ornithodoros turicata TaxID=34597 RepID=UPI003139F3B2